MTEYAALLAAVRAAPGDDLPRLVFADWLDDHGDPVRAGYVRAAVGMAGGERGAAAAVRAVPAEAVWGWLAADGLPVTTRWAAALGRRSVARGADRLTFADLGLRVELVRGFPERARCQAMTWVRFAHPLGRAYPLARVGLTDRAPYPHRDREWVWRLPAGAPVGPDNVLPAEVFDHLPGAQGYVAVYRTRRAAEGALSAACLGFARG